MNNVFRLGVGVSIRDSLLPFLLDHLSTTGWALVRVPHSEKIKEDLLAVAVLVGQAFSDGFGHHTLNAKDVSGTLPVHTEGIANSDGIIPYFALGCITPSTSGGETRLFDGRNAATLIDAVPELAGVVIEYSALADPNAKACYPLVVTDDGGRVVRYRAHVETNVIIQSGSLSEDEVYRRVDAIVQRCLMVSHRWEAGDLLFVNNRVTLHDRLPFTGERSMLRVRYNDVRYARFRY